MTMSAPERRDKMLGILREQRAASTRALSQALGVSQSTLRRDLDFLEEDGIVERMHGGVRLVGSADKMDKREISLFLRMEAQVAEKRAIARAALQFLEPDNVLMMDASTTCLYFARALPNDLHLTLITHGAYLPVDIADRSNLQVVCTGGVLNARSLCYYGYDAESAIQDLHAHRAFFGVKGVSLNEGCTDASLVEVRQKESMLSKAHELIILADYTKLGNIGLASFAPLNRIRVLITDELADEELVQKIRDRDVEVIVAPIALGEE